MVQQGYFLKKQFSPAVIQGISGAGGALLATVVTYPLLTFSTLQATSKQNKQKDDKRSNLLKEVAQLIGEEGAGVLFRGLGPTLLGTVVSQGLYFYLYAYFKSMVLEAKRNKKKSQQSISNDLSVIEASIVAFLAGCCNVLITNPIWVIATRMQTTKKQQDSQKNLGIVRVIINVYKDYGLLGYWKGVVPSLAMVSNPVIQYSLYEFLCTKWRQSKLVSNVKKLSPGEIFFLSGLAKMGSTVTTYPLLVVKSRLQAANKNDQLLAQYSSSTDAVIKILQQEGFGGFFKGMKAKLFQSVLAAAIMFMTKEQLNDIVQEAILKFQTNHDVK